MGALGGWLSHKNIGKKSSFTIGPVRLLRGYISIYPVKNHPWLKEYDIEDTYKNRIFLEGFQQSNRKDENYDKVKLLEDDLSSKLVKDYFFQEAFEDFGYHREEGEELLSNCQ